MGLCSWKINQHKIDANSSGNILYLHFKGHRLLPFTLSNLPSGASKIMWLGFVSKASAVLPDHSLHLHISPCISRACGKWGESSILFSMQRARAKLSKTFIVMVEVHIIRKYVIWYRLNNWNELRKPNGINCPLSCKLAVTVWDLSLHSLEWVLQFQTETCLDKVLVVAHLKTKSQTNLNF